MIFLGWDGERKKLWAIDTKDEDYARVKFAESTKNTDGDEFSIVALDGAMKMPIELTTLLGINE